MKKLVPPFLALLILVLIACDSLPQDTPIPAATPSGIVSPRAGTNTPTAAVTALPKAGSTATRGANPFPTMPSFPTASPSQPVRVLRIGHVGYPDVLDPQKASSNIEIEILRLAYEGLVTIDEKGVVQPGAADRWELSKDATQMVFHIRPGLKRADGSLLTARDYEYALRRAVDPRVTDKPNAFMLYDIKGAQELDTLDPAKTKPEDLAKPLANIGIQSPDDATLVLTFKKAVGYWGYIASGLTAFPSERKRVDQDPDSWWFRNDGHNGNGPFVVRTMEQGKRIVLVANPNYWRGRPTLDRIELVFYANSRQLVEAYKRGEIDLDAAVATDDLPTIAADPALAGDMVRYPAATTLAFGFNTARKPFDDRNVRVAFSQALDRRAWIQTVLKGVGQPYTRWIPPGVPGALSDKPGVPGYDPKSAVLTLINNGYAAKESTPDLPRVDCAKLGEVRLTFATSPLNTARFQFVADNWTRVLGCPIKLDPIDGAALKNNKDPRTRPQVFFLGYLEDYPHPQNWLSTNWACGATYADRAGYCNKTLDTLLATADREPDLAQAVAVYQQAEDLLLKDVPAAFTNHGENLYLMKSYVIGPKDHISSADIEFLGEWGPVWTFDIDVKRVPAEYPKK